MLLSKKETAKETTMLRTYIYHKTPECPRCHSQKVAYAVPLSENPIKNIIQHLKRGEYIYESNETQYNVVCINCHAQWKTSIPVIWLSKKELQEQKKIREIPLDEDVLKNIEEEMKLKWENEFTDKKSGKAKQLAVKALKISRTFLGV